MTAIPTNIADLVGRTPMVKLTRLAPECDVELFAKLEALNPGGSVKDRIGVAMIEAAEAEGRIEPGRTTIVEATSGNTGIALAFVCAAKGYDLVLTLPQGMSRERESLLRLYGARVEVTESMGGMSEAVQAAQGMARDADVFLPDQFTNPANPEAHRKHTGPEIEGALDGEVDVLVAGVGTGGTITGGGGALRQGNRKPGRGGGGRGHGWDDHGRRRVPAPGQPEAAGRGGRAARLGGALGRARRPSPHSGDRRGLRPTGAQPRAAGRGDRGLRRRRDPHGVGVRETGGPLGGHLVRGGAVGGARGGAAGGVEGQADSRRDAGLRRALRLPGVFRALSWG